jgi:hypothetical protein
MLIVKIDHIGAKALQAGVAGLLHVFRRAFYAQKFAVGSAHVAELGGQLDFAAAVFDRASDQLFIFARAIHVSRIKESAAKFNAAMDGCNGFLLVARAIKL